MEHPQEESKGVVGTDLVTEVYKVPFCHEEHGVHQNGQNSGEVVCLDDVAGPEGRPVAGEDPVDGHGVADGGQGQATHGH